MKKCVISTCKSKEDDADSNFMVPFKRKWRKYIPPGIKMFKFRNPKICSLHFEDEFKDQMTGSLKEKAIPKIFKYRKQNRKWPDLSESCRFCLTKLTKDKVNLDVELMNQFTELTQIELKTSFIYSKQVCKTCNENVKFGWKLRNTLISKQLFLISALESLECEKEDELEIVQPNIEVKLAEFEKFEIKEENDISMMSGTDHQIDAMSIKQEFEYDFETEDTDNFIDPNQTSSDNLEIPSTRSQPTKEENKTQWFKDEVLCTVCGITVLRSSIKRHVQRMHPKIKNKDVICDICGFATFLKNDMRSHMTKHIKERKFKCNECEKGFKTIPALHWHIKLMHRDGKKVEKFSCNYCGIDVSTKNSLKDHIYSQHLKEVRFECNEPGCGERFVCRRLFSQHKAKHAGIKFSCSQCDRYFYAKGKLNQHMKSHLKPMKCDLCEKSFATPSALKEHIKIVHENKRDHVCSYCGKSYHVPSHLNRHLIETHMNIKINCEIEGCKSKFARKETYRNHVKAHHKDLGDQKVQELLLKIRNMKVEFDERQVVN